MIKVNDYTISKQEYEQACRSYMAQQRKPEITADEKKAIAFQLVDANLVLNEAKKSNVEVPEQEVESALANIKGQFDSEENFQKAVENMGDTVDSLKDKLKDDIQLRIYLNKEFYEKAVVSDDEVKTFYNENEENFHTPEQIKASHILVKEENKAKEVEGKIKDGAEFAGLAKEYSECPSKEKGGDLGLFGRGQMVPEFEKAAFELKVNEVSGLVKTQFGYHIILKTDSVESTKQNFSDIQEKLKAHLQSQAAEKMIADKLEDLRKDATIDFDEKDL